MLKFKVDKIVKIEKENQAEELWNRYGYKYRKPKISKNGVIGYKLIAGLYIFYVTQEVLNECYKEGVVEENDNEPSDLWFREIRLAYGIDGFYRISYALVHSNVEDIRTALNRIQNEPPIIEITRYTCDWRITENKTMETLLIPKEAITINTHKMSIISIETFEKDLFSIFHNCGTYSEFLTALVTDVNREFCNSRHLMDRFSQYDGYSNEYLPQHKHKYKFTFMENNK